MSTGLQECAADRGGLSRRGPWPERRRDFTGGGALPWGPENRRRGTPTAGLGRAIRRDKRTRQAPRVPSSVCVWGGGGLGVCLQAWPCPRPSPHRHGVVHRSAGRPAPGRPGVVVAPGAPGTLPLQTPPPTPRDAPAADQSEQASGCSRPQCLTERQAGRARAVTRAPGPSSRPRCPGASCWRTTAGGPADTRGRAERSGRRRWQTPEWGPQYSPCPVRCPPFPLCARGGTAHAVARAAGAPVQTDTADN